jgi:predicted HicB family RNase H-like nuclease
MIPAFSGKAVLMDKPTKAHGNVGNTAAKKEVTADSQIQMRVNREEKAAWDKLAKAEGLTLSAWIRKTLSDARKKEKAEWANMAKAEGLTLSEWIDKKLNN